MTEPKLDVTLSLSEFLGTRRTFLGRAGTLSLCVLLAALGPPGRRSVRVCAATSELQHLVGALHAGIWNNHVHPGHYEHPAGDPPQWSRHVLAVRGRPEQGGHGAHLQSCDDFVVLRENRRERNGHDRLQERSRFELDAGQLDRYAVARPVRRRRQRPYHERSVQRGQRVGLRHARHQ